MANALAKGGLLRLYEALYQAYDLIRTPLHPFCNNGPNHDVERLFDRHKI